jgi:hypothetical protein
MRQSGTHNYGTGGAPPITVPTDQKIIEELVKFRRLLEQKNNDRVKKQLFSL